MKTEIKVAEYLTMSLTCRSTRLFILYFSPSVRSSRPLSSGFGDASADGSSSCSCSATLSPAGSAAAKPASESPAAASESPASASESPAPAASAAGDAGRGEGATSPPGISKCRRNNLLIWTGSRDKIKKFRSTLNRNQVVYEFLFTKIY
jgi:hypothetical protein